MNEAIVWLSFIGFFIAVFPIHIFNYVYVNTDEKYASVNVSAYRIIRILNVNTVKNSFDKMQVNGKEKKVNLNLVQKNSYKIFNNLCLTKIIQLSDFGLLNQNHAYVAFVQNALTTAVYSFIKANGGRTKLKNYTVINLSHDSINYYLKVVGIINVIVISKLIFILLLEKLNDVKN